jgi:hypothetical protein
MFGFTSIIRLSLADKIGSDNFSENIAEKVKGSKLTHEMAHSDVGKGKDSNASCEIIDKWNFNETNEWKNFTYANGDKTRLIVGLDDGNLQIYLNWIK